MKPVEFCGVSLKSIKEFGKAVQREIGHQLTRVQEGKEPTDWKPMKTIGPGVKEIRVKDEQGAFRVFYVETRPEAVYVLHAVQKTTEKTEKRDIDKAKAEFKRLG